MLLIETNLDERKMITMIIDSNRSMACEKYPLKNMKVRDD